MSIEYKLPAVFNSSVANGASNVSSNGSYFEVNLEQPMVIPREAKNVYLTVQAATVWWTVYNVTSANNAIRVIYFDGFITVDQTFTIEQGLYDLEHLNSELSRELFNNNFPADLFLLQPDQTNGTVIIQFNYTGAQVDLTIANNFASLIGFNQRLVPAAQTTTAPQYERSDNQAAFNSIDYFLIHSDLVSRGLRVNNVYNQAIAQVLIDTPPGSQIVSRPDNPPEIPAQELAGEERKILRFWLTDQDNNRVNTQGETFSLRLVIHYTMKA